MNQEQIDNLTLKVGELENTIKTLHEERKKDLLMFGEQVGRMTQDFSNLLTSGEFYNKVTEQVLERLKALDQLQNNMLECEVTLNPPGPDCFQFVAEADAGGLVVINCFHYPEGPDQPAQPIAFNDAGLDQLVHDGFQRANGELGVTYTARFLQVQPGEPAADPVTEAQEPEPGVPTSVEEPAAE